MESDVKPASFPADQGQPVMPFYMVCDVSYSMSGEMDALNDSLLRLRAEIIRKPAVDDVARLGVITFSDTAEVLLPLGQLSDTVMPRLEAKSGTLDGRPSRPCGRPSRRTGTNSRPRG